jgi:hypothetical protein
VAIELCAIVDCPNPGEVRAQVGWTGVFGPGTKGLLRPIAFCDEHARALRTGLPEEAIWVDQPPDRR